MSVVFKFILPALLGIATIYGVTSTINRVKMQKAINKQDKIIEDLQEEKQKVIKRAERAEKNTKELMDLYEKYKNTPVAVDTSDLSDSTLQRWLSGQLQ